MWFSSDLLGMTVNLCLAIMRVMNLLLLNTCAIFNQELIFLARSRITLWHWLLLLPPCVQAAQAMFCLLSAFTSTEAIDSHDANSFPYEFNAM